MIELKSGGTNALTPTPAIGGLGASPRLPLRRGEADIKAAYAICQACPTKQYTVNNEGWPICKKCSCNLDHKILVASSKCPDGHW